LVKQAPNSKNSGIGDWDRFKDGQAIRKLNPNSQKEKENDA